MGCCSWLMARTYDLAMRYSEEHCLGAWRAELLKQAHGITLEIGAGTGSNLPYLPDNLKLILSEPNQQMRKQLGRKLSRLPENNINMTDWPAEKLVVPDHSVDTIISTLVLCSVTDLKQVINEIYRALKPGGQLLFIEHVRSEKMTTLTWQKRLQPLWRSLCGNCHLTRETLETIRQRGLIIEEVTEGELCGAPAIVRNTFRGRARKPLEIADVFVENLDFDFDKYPSCPHCSGKDVARLLYGKPSLNRKTIEGLEKGTLISAGCYIHGGAPEWHCKRCGKDFGQRTFDINEQVNN